MGTHPETTMAKTMNVTKRDDGTLKQVWIKTTRKQKEAWMGCEYGSYEDSNMSRDHVYWTIRGSYWANIYLQSPERHGNDEAANLVNSLIYCTLNEQNPRIWAGLRNAFIEACEFLGRDDLVQKLRAATL